MARRDETYTSGWLKSPDMIAAGQEGGLNLTIESIRTGEVGQGAAKKTQRILTFKEDERELGLSPTAWDETAKALGVDDDDGWIGKTINVYPHEMDKPFNGHTHRIRVRKPLGAQQTAAIAKATGGTAGNVDVLRKAAFDALKANMMPDASTDDLKAAWLGAIAKAVPGKPQPQLTYEDWAKVKQQIEGYKGEAAGGSMDLDIPFGPNLI